MWTAPPICVEKLSHAFGRGRLRKVTLVDVSAKVEPGEILLLTGPSGSGKTTLLTLIGALRAAQEGSVRIFGEELRGASESTLSRIRRDIGYVFQSHNLLSALTVEQNVLMAFQLVQNTRRSVARERVREALARVGLEEHHASRIDQLSGGQRQRVAIARALINHPRIILADEPTSSLDRESGREVVDLIRQLARSESASVVLVTHDSRIFDVADRILHLEDGRIKPLQEAVATETSRMLHVLAEHEPGSHRTLIGFAIALARVANADRHLAQQEVDVIRKVLAEVAELAPGEVEFVVAIAIEGIRGSDDAKLFRSTFHRMAPTEKRRLVRALHAVAEADGVFTDSERDEIDRIVSELGD